MNVVVMPAVTPEMTSATVVRWLVAPGDRVEIDGVLAEIETDKTITELPCDVAGTVQRLLVAEGTEEVAVGTELVEITASDAVEVVQAGGEGGQDEEAKAPWGAVTDGPERAEVRPAVAAASGRCAPTQHLGATPPPGTVDGRAQRVAATLGQALAAQLGRTDTDEVAALLDLAGARPPEPVIGAQRSPPPHPAMLFDREPASALRRTIAKRMVASKQQAPHFYLTVECDVAALLSMRREVNSTEPSPRVTINDLLIRCLALAFEDEPALNVAWDDGDLLRYRQVDVAVAMATAQGLLTPVIRDAGKRGVRDISASLRQYAQRAASGDLTAAELSGGSTTLTNLGSFGVREAIAVLNPPQASILAIGAVEERAVVHGGTVTAGTRMSCTLSVDHRAADGAAAARILAAFRAIVEHPLRLIL